MMKRYLFTFALVFSLCCAALSNIDVKASDSEPGAIGSVVADFKLPDLDGKEQSLSSLKGKNATVLIFIGVQCPVSNAYNERMEKLAQDYRARGINVIGVNANSTESASEAKAHASSHNLTFPILKDNGNKLADRLGAERTPEAYVLDASNKIVYRGRIDNARNASSVSASELRDALEAVLAGKPVAKTSVPAFGCSIKRG
ncbi:MAG TPA: thioredoxin family protein [Pyrinomonadaceae bacterium]|nr:thioredoxin family protein [Pyrinomonadaceae bacterium]